jgi:hypothetical protein
MAAKSSASEGVAVVTRPEEFITVAVEKSFRENQRIAVKRRLFLQYIKIGKFS